MLRILGNIIWLLFGGIELAIGWLLIGLIMMVTIIGIPWARACFSMARFVVWPFGSVAVDRAAYTGEEDIGTGSLGFIGNIIWLVFGGIWLAIGHLLAAVCTAITIIGIPFAIQHIKIGVMALTPIGKVIVSKEEAASKGIAH